MCVYLPSSAVSFQSCHSLCSVIQCAGAAAAPTAKVSGVELDSLISQVKDLLPELGEGFILACLEEYSYSAEQVINNILEDKLVPFLDKLDRTMQRCGGLWHFCFHTVDY